MSTEKTPTNTTGNTLGENDDPIYDAWDEGCNACQGGMAITANPYPAGTNKHKGWNRGWKDANKDMPL